MNAEKPLIFRLNDGGPGPDLVREVLLARGWTEFDKSVHARYEWNLWWRTSRFRISDYEQIFPWQRLNHYPKSTGITRKDNLARLLKLMAGLYGGLYNFVPLSFVLPHEYRKFVADYSANAKETAQFWIYKPADLSRGRGIFVFRELSDLQYDSHCVVQKYITNSLLISDYKFDLRMYVVVFSYHPLVLYVYNEGLARFSTEKFNLTTLSNVFSHLTNTSINKNSPSYNTDKVGIGPGCKWTITQLRHYLRHKELDDSTLWWRVVALLILTIVPQATEVPNVKVDNSSSDGGACFELFGFDILIDESLKPWLLEVNFSPALTTDCAIDVTVKTAMLNDLVDMMAFGEEDALCGGEIFRRRQRNITSPLARARILRPAVSGRSLPDVLCAGLRPPSTSTAKTSARAENGAYSAVSRCTESNGEHRYTEVEDESLQLSHSSLKGNRAYISATSDGLQNSRKLRRSLTSDCSSSDSEPRMRSACKRRVAASAGERGRTVQQDRTECDSLQENPIGQRRYSDDVKANVAQKSRSQKRSREAPKRIGGFVRIYPFNEITKRPTLSLRNMVAETGKLVRQQIESLAQQKKGARPHKGSYDIDHPFPSVRRERGKTVYYSFS